MEKKLSKKDEKGITQSNLISRAIYKCTPMARKLIAYSMKQFIQNDPEKSVKEFLANFTIAEFLNALNMSRNDKNYLTVKQAVIECKKLQIVLQNTKACYEAFSWFTYVLYEENNNQIKMRFSSEITNIIRNWKQTGYSYIDLNVIGKLKNIYSIRWYELSLSYYNLKDNHGYWYFKMTIDEIKRIFQIKNDNRHFLETIINNPIKALNDVNPFFEITVEKEWQGKGKKIVSIILNCQERKAKLIADESKKERNKIKADIDNLALKEVKQNALEVTEEKKRIENIKSMHMLEYAQLLQAEYQKTSDSFPPNIRSSFAESNAISILLEKYKDE